MDEEDIVAVEQGGAVPGSCSQYFCCPVVVIEITNIAVTCCIKSSMLFVLAHCPP